MVGNRSKESTGEKFAGRALAVASVAAVYDRRRAPRYPSGAVHRKPLQKHQKIMQVKFFQIPSGGCAAIEAEMNTFLRSHRKRRGHGRLGRVETDFRFAWDQLLP